MEAITSPPAPINEPNLNYAPGSRERAGIEPAAYDPDGVGDLGSHAVQEIPDLLG
jgi:hypothetical protein